MIRNLFYTSISILLIIGCARVGSPTGGPKDEKPPVTISAVPDFGTKNFKANKIKINFDEFIKFKDLNKQLIISPPMQFAPEITPMGIASKSINIKILDTLQPNTTYTFNFGNSIVDNAESNPLKQFKYVFSTGNTIDSLQIKGSITDAVKMQPEKEVMVMLYEVNDDYNDSIVYQKKPNYVSSTLDSTLYQITNIKAGTYRLIALKDKSNNQIFNEKEDKIGFLNNFITLPQDSLPQKITLFKPKPDFSIKKITETAKNHAIIAYEGHWISTITDVTDSQGNAVKFTLQNEINRDSVHLWYQSKNSDTLIVKTKQNEIVKDFKFKQRSSKIDSLKVKSDVLSVLHFRDTLSFTTNIPISKLNPEKIQLFESDSIALPFSSILNDNKDKLFINFTKKPTTTYKAVILPNALEDFFGNANDSIVNKFSVKRIEDYGDIQLQVKKLNNHPVIIELLTDKGELVAKEIILESKKLVFNTLEPKKYIIRAIIDLNNNQRWDTGNFLKQLQPEPIIYFSKIIELRTNWTINEEFVVD